MSAEQAAERITLPPRYRGRLGRAVRRCVCAAPGRSAGCKVVAIIARRCPSSLYFLLWLIFARGLPSAESLLTYEPVLPTYVRDVNGEPVQSLRPRAPRPARL